MTTTKRSTTRSEYQAAPRTRKSGVVRVSSAKPVDLPEPQRLLIHDTDRFLFKGHMFDVEATQDFDVKKGIGPIRIVIKFDDAIVDFYRTRAVRQIENGFAYLELVRWTRKASKSTKQWERLINSEYRSAYGMNCR